MIKADLHIHTTASDGQYSPSEVVKAAKLSGIQCIAITDHDTIDGVAEGTATGTENGIIVLRGIELGASEHRSLHILGLGLAEHSPDLEKLCRKLRDSREEIDLHARRRAYARVAQESTIACKNTLNHRRRHLTHAASKARNVSSAWNASAHST